MRRGPGVSPRGGIRRRHRPATGVVDDQCGARGVDTVGGGSRAHGANSSPTRAPRRDRGGTTSSGHERLRLHQRHSPRHGGRGRHRPGYRPGIPRRRRPGGVGRPAQGRGERTATGWAASGSSPAPSTCGREKSVQAFFAAAERALGPVTIAVANAGIYPNCPVVDMTVEEWDGVIETNMRGRRRAVEHVTQPVGVSARMPMRDERPRDYGFVRFYLVTSRGDAQIQGGGLFGYPLYAHRGYTPLSHTGIPPIPQGIPPGIPTPDIRARSSRVRSSRF